MHEEFQGYKPSWEFQVCPFLWGLQVKHEVGKTGGNWMNLDMIKTIPLFSQQTKLYPFYLCNHVRMINTQHVSPYQT